MRLIIMTLLFLTFFTGLAGAQTITVSSTGGNSDQDVINSAIDSATPGDTVYLTSGVFLVDNTVIVKSNLHLTGDPDAIIRVAPTSTQWFKGSVGVISCKEVIKNIEISGFQIDGNIKNLPPSFSDSRPDTASDCEKLIILGGYFGNYAENISIHDMKLYFSFSDGIYIHAAKNVFCYNNEIICCRHSDIFLSVCLDSEIYNNRIEGITSDNIRLDNCVRAKVKDNILLSFSGNSFGAYLFGQNGLQVGDAGSSHGYDASGNPTHTTDIEVTGNTFVAPMLRTIWLDATGKGVTNVWIHDNKYIGKEGLETTGFSFNLSNVSEINLPTIEQSEEVFSSIIDISDSGYVGQSSVFNPDKTLMSKGSDSAWLDVVGYTGEIHIGNDTYIPKPANESAIVVSGTQTKRDRVVSQESTKKLTGNLTVDLEVKTTFEVPEKNKITIFGKSLNYTTYRKVSENTTFSKTFKAPVLFPAFQAPNVSVTNFNGSHAVVTIPDMPGIVKIDYTYDNSTATEYRLIGYVGSATNGFKSTDYEVTEKYLFDNSGMLSQGLDGLYIKDKNFDLSKLNVNVVTPYDSFNISHFEYTVIEDEHLKFFKWGFVGILGYFFIFGRAIHKIIYSVVGKWI
jgi:Pectate lyase superfamily protein